MNRQAIVANALWGAQVATQRPKQIHYGEVRPIRGADRALPLTTDCSGFVTLCYQWAGAPDPNGGKYNGSGSTGMMLEACAHIASRTAQLGDLVVFGDPPGTHVVLIVELRFRSGRRQPWLGERSAQVATVAGGDRPRRRAAHLPVGRPPPADTSRRARADHDDRRCRSRAVTQPGSEAPDRGPGRGREARRPAEPQSRRRDSNSRPLHYEWPVSRAMPGFRAVLTELGSS